jgi:hypothetical protein
MVQAVCRQPVTTRKRIQSQARLCWLCGEQRDSGTDFSPSTFVFPVSVTARVFHTHSFMYHPRNGIFAIDSAVK